MPQLDPSIPSIPSIPQSDALNSRLLWNILAHDVGNTGWEVAVAMADRRIFINYRRDDSRADSGRLYDRLAARFPGRVFRDVASLEPGIEWHEAIERVIGQSDACVVVIGKNWLDMKDASGRRRLDDSRDTVRREIVAALEHKMRVFPVLVGGAKMPAEEDLPEELQPLCRRNGLEITEQDWDHDVATLIQGLDKALGILPEPPSPPAPQPSPAAFRNPLAWLAVAVPIIAVAVYLGVKPPAATPPIIIDNHLGGSTPSPSPPNGGGEKPGSSSVRGNLPPAPQSFPDSRNTAGPSESERLLESIGRRPDSGSLGSSPSEARTTTTRGGQPVDTYAPPARPALNPAQLVGNWNALVSGPGGVGEPIREVIGVYGDYSYLVMVQGVARAVGRWQYNPSADSIQFSGVNLLNNGVKYNCTLQNTDLEHQGFGGGCSDLLQNSWNISLMHAGGRPLDAVNIPRVNVSLLSSAERAAFAQLLAAGRCTCPCALTLMTCLQKDQSCPYSPGIANTALAQFLRMTRS